MEVLVEEQRLDHGSQEQQHSIEIAMPVRLGVILGEPDHQPAAVFRTCGIFNDKDIVTPLPPSPLSLPLPSPSLLEQLGAGKGKNILDEFEDKLGSDCLEEGLAKSQD